MARIVGAHSILYSTRPDADRAFLRDVIGLTHLDVGGGWLIFGLPPSEVAVHPGEKNDVHEFYLMCDDVESFVAGMEKKSVACSPVRNLGWGMLTTVTLPGGGSLGVYQPRHGRPKAMALEPAKRAGKRAKARKPPARKTSRTGGKKRRAARG
jgi:hypothetical protein